MKLTTKNLRQIIREEVANVANEAQRRPEWARGGANYDAEREEDRYWDNADVPRPRDRSDRDWDAPSEQSWEDKDWEVGTFFNIVEWYFKKSDPNYSHTDFTDKHRDELVAAWEAGDLNDAIKWSKEYTKPEWASDMTDMSMQKHMDLLINKPGWFKYRVGMLGR